MQLTGQTACGNLTAAHLSGVRFLNFEDVGIIVLQAHDFDGLSNLSSLWLSRNSLSTLPEGVFSGLSNLQQLFLNRNSLTALPEGIFSGLNELGILWLAGNRLSVLPERVFSGLGKLENLTLAENSLSGLPEDIFRGLSNLRALLFDVNSLTTLPEGIFNGLNKLELLSLQRNKLSTLPEGIFSGLDKLERLWLQGNKLSALPEGVFDDMLETLQDLIVDSHLKSRLTFPLTAQTGLEGTTVRARVRLSRALPVAVRVPYSLGGTAAADDYTDLSPDPNQGLLFLAGETSKEIVFTLSEDEDSTEETVVLSLGELSRIRMRRSDGIGTDAPHLQAEFLLERADEGVVHTVTIYSQDDLSDVCARTRQVRDKLVESTGVSTCAQVTLEHLAGVTDLDLSGAGITVLGVNDFFGLSSLKSLWLSRNALIELPGGIFAGLSSLKELRLSNNFLAGFPEGIFDDLLDTLEVLQIDPDLKATLAFEATEQETVEGATVQVRVRLSRPLPVAVRVPYSVGGTATADDYRDLLPDPNQGLLFLAGQTSREIGFTLTKGAEGRRKTIVLRLGQLSRIALGRADEIGGDAPHLKAESVVVRPEEGAVHTVSIASVIDALDVCGRTPQVRDKLVEVAGVSSCTHLTLQHLAGVADLDLSGTGISVLQAGDFVGLSFLRVLWLHNNSLEDLPEGVFDDVLDTLEDLRVDPQLKATLYFERAGQKTVAGATVEISVWLSRPLPVAVRVPFSVSGTATRDDYKDLSASPSAGVMFKSRYGIQRITVTVPEGSEALGKTIVLTLGDLSRIELGRSDGAGSYAPQLKAESLIERPAERAVHTVSIAYPNQPADICDRTPQVRDALLGSIPEVSSCAEVTTAQLASVIHLQLLNSGIAALQENDFRGLIGMRDLSLNDNSLSSLPEGVFHGLDSLRNLSLNDNSLTTLPEGIFAELDLLFELNLQFNTLVSLPEGVFDGLSSLKWLSLFNNPLSDLPEDVFSGLSNLRSLLLGNNRLSELPAGIFSGLGSLQRLWLFSNSLTTLPTGVFNGLSNLRELSLKSNHLNELSGDVFKGMSKLEILELGRNDLTSLPEGVFSDLNSLKILILQTNELSSLPENVFRGLYSLEHLWLNVNNLSELPEEIFTDLSLLDELLLHQNSLEELPRGIFSGLGRLRHMRLHRNPLGSLREEVFGGLSNLQFLRLTGCDLSNLPKGVFDRLDSLEYLFLEANPLDMLPTGIFDDVLDTLEDLRVDRDLKAQLAFSPGAQQVARGTTVKVPVVLSRPLPVSVRVSYNLGFSGAEGGLTGLSPDPHKGLLFLAGETSQQISFDLVKEGGTRGEKTIVVSLGNFSEVGLLRSDGSGHDAPYLDTESLLLLFDDPATHTIAVSDSDPEDESPFCLSLWEGSQCSTVASLPHALMGLIGESIAQTEVVITHKDPLPADCELALLFHQGTFPSPSVSFDSEFPDQNVLRTTIPRGGARILTLASPDATEPVAGAVHVFTRSPCNSDSLQVQGRYLVADSSSGEIDELFSVEGQSARDWLGDGDCLRLTGVPGSRRNVAFASVTARAQQAAPPGTRLRLGAYDLKGNFIRQLPSLEISGAHQVWSPWNFDRPVTIQMCLDVPGASSFQLAVTAIGSEVTGNTVQYFSNSLPATPDPEPAGLDP